MIWKVLTVVFGAIIMTGCASNPYDRASAPHITHVVEGRVVAIRPDGAKNDIRVGDTVTTAIAANNVGNVPVMRGLIVLDAISILTEKKPGDVYTILDEKTQTERKFHSSHMYGGGGEKAELGDHLRALYAKAGWWTVYNLTKNPELDEKTR